MPNIVKSIIISLVVGIIAFLLLGFIQAQTLQVPNNTDLIIELLVGIAAVFGGCIWLSAWGHHEGGAVVSHGREHGTVKWFNVKKGYGFITRDSGDDVFVHFRNLSSGRRSISDGQRVSFIVVDGDKGLQADEVEAIS